MRTEPTPVFLAVLNEAFQAETLEERVDALEAIAILGEHGLSEDDKVEATCALISWFVNASAPDRKEVLEKYDALMIKAGLQTYQETINSRAVDCDLLAAYGVTTKPEPQPEHWLYDYDLENPIDTPCPPAPSDGRPELGQPGIELE